MHLRYFAGMSVKESAGALGLSGRTLHRHGRFLEAWLTSRPGKPG
jgi:hypothetical protein